MLAGPGKSCRAAQWVFDRQSMETAGRGACLKQERFHQRWPCMASFSFLSSPHTFLPFLACSLVLSVFCHLAKLFLSNISLFVLYSLSDILHFPVFSSSSRHVISPTAELREGWYCNDRVVLSSPELLFFAFFLPLNWHFLFVWLSCGLCAILKV